MTRLQKKETKSEKRAGHTQHLAIPTPTRGNKIERKDCSFLYADWAYESSDRNEIGVVCHQDCSLAHYVFISTSGLTISVFYYLLKICVSVSMVFKYRYGIKELQYCSILHLFSSVLP